MEGIAYVTKWRGCVKTPDAIIEACPRREPVIRVAELAQRLRGMFLKVPATVDVGLAQSRQRQP